MHVRIDEPWCDESPAHVDPFGRVGVGTDAGESAAGDGDITPLDLTRENIDDTRVGKHKLRGRVTSGDSTQARVGWGMTHLMTGLMHGCLQTGARTIRGMQHSPRLLMRLVTVALFFGTAMAILPAAAQVPVPATVEPETQPARPASTAQTSPRATVIEFFNTMNRIEQSASLLGQNPQRRLPELFDISIINADQVETRARMLKVFLDRLEFVRTRFIPDAEEVESSSIATYTLYPRDDRPSHARFQRLTDEYSVTLVLDEQDGQWKFSEQTYEHIPALFLATRGEPARFSSVPTTITRPMLLRAVIPAELQSRKFAGIEAWQGIAIVALVLIGLTLDLASRLLLRWIWTRFANGNKHKDRVDSELLAKTVRPFGVLVAAVFWFATLNLLDLNPLPLAVLSVAIRFFLAVAMVLAAFRLTDLTSDYFLRKAKRTRSKFDDLLIPLLRKTTKVVLAILAAIYVAESLSIEILPLLTGLGIGGIAVAFAAKDTIENFFGSVAVILDRPFEVGDWVQIDSLEGTVEELGLRSTRIRTFYNSLVTVPNSVLVRATVDNFGKRRYRRYRTMLNITYDTPPERIDAFCEGVREIIREHPYTRKDYYHVYLNEFGAHSLDILLYIFFQAPDWPTEIRERHRLMLDVIRLAHRLGVSFAFPTQTLHLVRDEGGLPEPQPGHPESNAELAARQAGQDAAKEIMAEQPWRSRRPGAVVFDGMEGKLDQQ